MTEIGLFLWELILYGLIGLGLLAVTAAWLFVAYAVIRLVAEFVRAYKATKDLDLDPEQESW